ncbi:type II methionyl aminopeptidase [Candidatus Micrarchaeota archaeon]|nr:type II methionyl aminopeptidase [Candidatus Micrarchaeota archaeon]
MEKNEFEDYVKSGKVLQEVQKNAVKKAKVGVKLLELAETIEKEILDLEAGMAFPVNLSLNNIAAHYTPSFKDETLIEEKDVLKIDIGVEVEGFIADASVTMDFSGENGKLVEASEKALENVLSMVKVGTPLGKIGEEIEKTILSYGFKPVENLTGHGLMKYIAHSSPSIPNIAKNDSRAIEDGKAYAIEPFASNGEGRIKEGSQSEIFEFSKAIPLRNLDARKIQEKSIIEFNGLPFAERWLIKEFGETKTKIALRELIGKSSIRMHPILKEDSNVLISQAEHTIVCFEEKIHITTQPKAKD